MFRMLVSIGTSLVIFMLTVVLCGVGVVVLDHAEISIISRLIIVALLFGSTVWLVSRILKLIFASEQGEKKKKRPPLPD